VQDVIDRADSWRRSGIPFALAVVVAVEGSGPREPGAVMAVNASGEVVGSVSGGCVEGAVVAEALSRMGAPAPTLEAFGIYGKGEERSAATLSFGYSDEVGLSVGLTCGGTFHILIDPNPESTVAALAEALGANDPFVLALVYEVHEEEDSFFAEENRGVDLPELGSAILVRESGNLAGTLGNEDLDRVVIRGARAALGAGRGSRARFGRKGQSRSEEVSVVYVAVSRPAHLVVFGAVDFSAALTRAAKFLGYTVTVCDARPVFATPERFPEADEVLVQWPDTYLREQGHDLGVRDAICILTHDPKFDVPAIRAALGTQAGYIGVMGSRRTHEQRLAKLREVGVSPQDLERIAAPVGLDIGAVSPEETAISIVAEIIQKRSSRPGTPLVRSTGSIHDSGVLTW